MRIAHFSAWDSGVGPANAAYRIHKELLRSNVDSTMWVAQKTKPDREIRLLSSGGFFRRQFRRFQMAINRRISSRAQQKSDDQVDTGLFGLDPTPAIQQTRPDIVQLHWLGFSTIRIRDLPRFTCPIVWRLPDMWAFSGIEAYPERPENYTVDQVDSYLAGNPFAIDSIVWKNKRRAYRQLANLTIVSPSRWLADWAKRSALLQGRRVEVIGTGCDIETFLPRPSTECRNVLGLPLDKKLVLAGADLWTCPRKGADLLVKTLKTLRASSLGPNIHFAIYGAGSDAIKDECGSFATSFGHIKNDILMSILQSASDIFVATSRKENLANTVLESMACGTPCAAFNIGGMPDVIRHEESGFLAEPFDIAHLVSGITNVLEGRYPRMRSHARDTIVAKYSVLEQGRQYCQLYSNILEQSGAGHLKNAA